MDKCKTIIMQQLPGVYRSLLEPLSFHNLEEIRFRVGSPVMLYGHGTYHYLDSHGGGTQDINCAKITLKAEMNALAAALCEHSVYAHLHNMRDGFITLRGGHRAGLAGKAIIKDGQLSGLTEISGINLRIARPYVGCAQSLSARLLRNNRIKNTLLLSPPQCGKTTLLRDLTRIFSAKFKISVVDERSEIAGMYEGTPQFDLGSQTDVLDRFPKSIGMLLAVRSLSPQIIVTDELGGEADRNALLHVLGTGCRIIASIHGDSPEELSTEHQKLLSCFDVAVILGRQNNRPAVLDIKELK
ncbi:MAG: stage III sporulation protein AA [Ruminococcaceae bacterium]|nr:stage III sporulation protein AA [Oscillospiraceae bacterium]